MTAQTGFSFEIAKKIFKMFLRAIYLMVPITTLQSHLLIYFSTKSKKNNYQFQKNQKFSNRF